MAIIISYICCINCSVLDVKILDIILNVESLQSTLHPNTANWDDTHHARRQLDFVKQQRTHDPAVSCNYSNIFPSYESQYIESKPLMDPIVV